MKRKVLLGYIDMDVILRPGVLVLTSKDML